MAKTPPQPAAGKAPHIYELIVQQHQTVSPVPIAQNEIVITLGGSAFYTYPYRTE